MVDDNRQLCAIVESMDGRLQAKLLEIDIAVSGADVSALLREIEHAIIMNYRIARHHGETPFVGILNRPSISEYHWPNQASKLGEIDLPQEVGEALAAALRMRKPISRILVCRQAA